MGIAGTGMGAFAGLLKEAGFLVQGSDQNVYPPMSDKLADWGIEAKSPYAPANLEPTPDLVVVGNVIRKDNVEAVEMRRREVPHVSFPDALKQFFLKDRHSVVVAGTHGKTTTSALLAHTLFSAGRDPGFLIGGILNDFQESFRLGSENADSPFVIEGDEYDTAYFDKGPKFLHYQPRSLLCTSLEFDHADIYDDVETIVSRFKELLSLVPKNGQIVLCAHAPHLLRAARESLTNTEIMTYGFEGDWQATDVHEGQSGVSFTPVFRGEKRSPVSLPLSGQHSILNALGSYAILEGLGLNAEQIKAGFSSFQSVKRRMEIVGEARGVKVIDDFAHHPTAVKTTLEGARKMYPTSRIWALFEPRSASSCRRVFQADYAAAFDAADAVVLAPLGRELPPEEALDLNQLAVDIESRGVQCKAGLSIDAIVDHVIPLVSKGDVLLCMSNGAFGNIHQKLTVALKESSS